MRYLQPFRSYRNFRSFSRDPLHYFINNFFICCPINFIPVPLVSQVFCASLSSGDFVLRLPLLEFVPTPSPFSSWSSSWSSPSSSPRSVTIYIAERARLVLFGSCCSVRALLFVLFVLFAVFSSYVLVREVSEFEKTFESIVDQSIFMNRSSFSIHGM